MASMTLITPPFLFHIKNEITFYRSDESPDRGRISLFSKQSHVVRLDIRGDYTIEWLDTTGKNKRGHPTITNMERKITTKDRYIPKTENNKKKLSLSFPSALAKINIDSYDVSFSVNSGNYKLIGEDYGISATQRLVFYGDPIFACIHPGRDDSRKDMMTTYYVNAYKI